MYKKYISKIIIFLDITYKLFYLIVKIININIKQKINEHFLFNMIEYEYS